MSNGEMRTSRAAQQALARCLTERLPPSLKATGFTVPVQAGVGKRTHDTINIYFYFMCFTFRSTRATDDRITYFMQSIFALIFLHSSCSPLTLTVKKISERARRDSRLIDETPQSVGERHVRTRQVLVDSMEAEEDANKVVSTFERDCVLSIAAFTTDEGDEQALAARIIEALAEMPEPRPEALAIETRIHHSSEASARGKTATARIGFSSASDAASAMLYLRSGVKWLEGVSITQCSNRKFTTRIVHDLGASRP